MIKYKSLYLAAALIALTSGCATATEPASTSEYLILPPPRETGPKVYGLMCTNKTTMCNYNWDTLCVKGKAKNADPNGNVIDSPAYMSTNHGYRARLFVCE